MKSHTIEDPLIMSEYAYYYNELMPKENQHVFELVDLSVAHELKKQLEKSLKLYECQNNTILKQSALMAEMAEALTRISDMANPEIITDSGFYYAAQKALTKYNQYINKQPK